MTHHPRHRQLHKRAQRALTELLHAAARALRLIEQHTSTTIHVQMDAKRSPWDSMVAQSNAVYYAKNAEKLAKVNQSWREANPERLKQIRDDHYQQNKVRYNTASKGRKTHIARATPSWADLDAIKAVYAEAARLSDATGISHEVDHIVPLRGIDVCGLHVHWNLEPLPASINSSKGAVVVGRNTTATRMLQETLSGADLRR